MRRDELIGLAATMAAPYRISPPDQRGGGRSGLFAGMGDGQSVDFHDHREYKPGDDLRRVDWLAYARSGQMHLKLFREEVSPVVELLLDTSASVAAYPGKEQAVLFAAAFLRAAVSAAEGRPVLCRDGRRFSGADFDAALMATEFGGADRFDFGAARGPGRPLRFHLSDFLFGEDAAPLFRRQAAGSLLFTPVMVLGRSERDPSARGHYRLRDVEAPDDALDLTVDDAACARYRLRLRTHVDGLESEARRLGGRLISLGVPDRELERSDCEAIAGRFAQERVVTTR